MDSPVSVDTTSILEHYREITLCVDLMYVNKVPLLVTLSRYKKFGTMEAVADRKEKTILKCIKGVIAIYRKAGFRVTTALMDGEFVPLCWGLAELGVRLNETSRDEHVGDVERYIHTVKERIRAIYNTLPFQKIPARLVIEMVKTAVFWLNAFPAAGGASQDLSPRTILTGQQINYKRHCHFQFGEYTQTHEEHNNSMNPRTVGAIALRPGGNGQGSFYFLSITTGRVLNRLHTTALPMPDDVINKLHRMARQQKSNPGLIFADRNLNPEEYDDDDNDETYHDNNESEDEDDLGHNDEEDSDTDDDEMVAPGPPEAGGEIAPNNNVGDDEDDDIESEDEVAESDNEEDDEVEPLVIENDGNSDEDEAEEEQQPPDMVPGEDAGAMEADQNDGQDGPVLEEIPGVNDEEVEPEIPGVGAGEEDEVTEQQPPAPPRDHNDTGTRYNLRGGRGRNYDHRYAAGDFIVEDENGIVMTTEGTGEVLETPQMSLKAGLRTFGTDGMKAVEKEMKQLHDQDVMIPVHKKSLTPEQRREVLAYLMFLKRKRCGKIKGCGCADGRKQRAYIAKEDSTAPTVSTEAVFLTAGIDALENRDVAVLNVPGAFMQADMDELVHVRFTGEMVKMLLQIDKQMYSEYVVMEKGEQVMYMELLKALYGALRAACLFWQKLSKQLIDVWGFVPNKYDDCMVNKMINGNQMTMVWHVDDSKVSHANAKEVGKFIHQMEETFGKETPLSVSRGKTHGYLGMSIDFGNKGEVRIDMEHYINMMLHDAPKEMDGISSTPAAAHLFKTNPEGPKLLGMSGKRSSFI